MGNTPNNNFPYPEASGLVKDGWEDIKDLADSIDTKLGVYSTPGMVKLASVSFSGVSSQAVTFASSTYDNYRILINIDTNSLSDSALTIKLRSGATDNSGASYSYAALTKTRANADSNFSGADLTTGWRVAVLDNGGGANTTSYTALAIDLFDNFASRWTKMTYAGHFLNTSTVPSMVTGAGFHAVAASYDGINFISDSATMTGTIYLYGYNK
jgi:hypothetical protein